MIARQEADSETVGEEEDESLGLDHQRGSQWHRHNDRGCSKDVHWVHVHTQGERKKSLLA